MHHIHSVNGQKKAKNCKNTGNFVSEVFAPGPNSGSREAREVKRARLNSTHQGGGGEFSVSGNERG